METDDVNSGDVAIAVISYTEHVYALKRPSATAVRRRNGDWPKRSSPDHRCRLRSLRLSQSSPKPAAIYVVHNGETSATARRNLQRLLRRFPISHYLNEAVSNRARARNVGLSQTRSPFVLMCDGDTLPPPRTIRAALATASLDSFSCGARRRFISLATSINKIRRLVTQDQWGTLEEISNDYQSPGQGERKSFGRTVDESTFVTSFGILPRTAIDALGFMDERYEGWGLEDTDFMRKLVSLLEFRSLAEHDVYHMDHLVSPYKWYEHWQSNYPRFMRSSSTSGLFIFTDLFGRERVPARDPTVLVPCQEATIREDLLPRDLAKGARDEILEYTEHLGKKTNTAAVFLTGSAVHKPRPNDCDLIRVLFAGPTRFFSAGRRLDVQEMSLDTIRQEYRHPQWLPQSWTWTLGKYHYAIPVFQKVDLKSLLSTWENKYLSRFAGHLLTYHLGRSARLSERLHEETTDEATWEMLRDCAVLVGLANRKLPARWRFPYYPATPQFESIVVAMQEIMTQRRCWARLAESLRTIVERATTEWTIGLSYGKVFFGDSERGAQLITEMGLGSRQMEWTEHG